MTETSRELLESALSGSDGRTWDQAVIRNAAKKYLAQLPPYPPALVERIRKALGNTVGDAWAVAVLDALNGEIAADIEPVVMHHGELTDEEARTIARATIAKVKEQQRTEVTELRELLADIVQKAHPYGVQDGDFIASYLLATGPIHRAIRYLNEHGISTVADASTGEKE
jgi:hypothetical protein